MSFKPALVVVDMQEDFCRLDGWSRYRTDYQRVLEYPFALKVATKDYHPRDHISFASNHTAPNNKPFESTVTIKNPHNPEETQETRLWPDHCIQGTKGAELLPELLVSKVDRIVEKGQDKRVEMYSAFADPFKSPCVAKSNLAETLRMAGITDVYVVGLQPTIV
ncbi:pyrazinamidase nicotinamidase [Pyrenophora tritici-repentis]|nr:pyrazinamidase nicotinamidase [Pyrenophora tritici-repentis]